MTRESSQPGKLQESAHSTRAHDRASRYFRDQDQRGAHHEGSDPRVFAPNQCSIACAPTAYATDDSQEARKLILSGRLFSLSCACELPGGDEEAIIMGACAVRGAARRWPRIDGDGGPGQADIQGKRTHLSTIPQLLRRPRQRPVPSRIPGKGPIPPKREPQHRRQKGKSTRTSTRAAESRHATGRPVFVPSRVFDSLSAHVRKEGILEQRSSQISSLGNHMVDMVRIAVLVQQKNKMTARGIPPVPNSTGLELSYDSGGSRHVRRSEPGGGQPAVTAPGPDSYWPNGDWLAVQGPSLPRAPPQKSGR
ncbi:hypothetical protein EDB83DRAFT_2312680 [Lactarius deliciosus]|nr:hypothetical protein EDB83DRAFT_2312680 [Lactarius deliciosus]